MQQLIDDLLRRPEIIPAAAYDSPEIMTRWVQQCGPKKSAASIAQMGRRQRLPDGLGPTAQKLLREQYGPTYAAAILAATQTDPNLIAAAAEDESPTIRAGVTANPALDVTYAEELAGDLAAYGGEEVLLQPEWAEWLTTETGVAVIKEWYHRQATASSAEQKLRVYAEGRPEVLTAWLEASLIQNLPHNLEAVRTALEIGKYSAAVSTIAYAELDPDEVEALLDEHITADPEAGRKLADAFTSKIAGRGGRTKDGACMDVLVRVSAEHADIDQVRSWRNVAQTVFDQLGDPEKLGAVLHYADTGGGELAERGNAVEILRIAVQHSLGDYNSRRRLNQVAGGLAEAYADGGRLEELAEVVEICLGNGLEGAFSLRNSTPSAIDDDADAARFTELIGQKAAATLSTMSVEWRRRLRRHIVIEDMIDTPEAARAVGIHDAEDADWITENRYWERYLQLRLTGTESRVLSREYQQIWEIPALKGLSEETISAFLDAVPKSMWYDLADSNRVAAMKQGNLRVDLLQTKKLRQVRAWVSEGAGDVAKFRVKRLLGDIEKHLADREGADIFELTRRVTEATQNTNLKEILGFERYEELLSKVADHLGTDPGSWGMYAGLEEEWTGDVDGLLWLVTDKAPETADELDPL